MVFLRGVMLAAAIVAFVGYALAGLVAYMNGLHYLLGWPVWAELVVFVVTMFLRLTIVLVPVMFYGAWKVWQWHWALALVFAAPGLILSVGALLGVGFGALGDRLARRA